LFVTAGVAATARPAGNGSANVIRDNGVVGFGFVNVNVNRVVPPTATVDGVNALVRVGGAVTGTTASEAVAGVTETPPSAEVTSNTVFVATPVSVAVTGNATVHDDDAATVAPDSETVPTVARTIPPGHVVTALPATCKTAGSTSTMVTPVCGIVAGFVMVSVTVEVLPTTIVDGENDLASCNGEGTGTTAPAGPADSTNPAAATHNTNRTRSSLIVASSSHDESDAV
jgi:hypothetical protein